MNTCRVCNVAKPETDFYRQSRGNNLLYTQCKDCDNARRREHRSTKAAHYLEYDRARANTEKRRAAREVYNKSPAGRATANKRVADWIARNPLKKAATQKVNGAIRSGRLIRQPCEVCAESKAQAHHDDYSKPLDVRWLCTKHHAEWHKQNTPLCPDQEKAA